MELGELQKRASQGRRDGVALTRKTETEQIAAAHGRSVNWYSRPQAAGRERLLSAQAQCDSLSRNALGV